MLKFKIEHCGIYGVKNVQLFFRGWVENRAEYIEVYHHDKVIFHYDLKHTDSRIIRFDLMEPISEVSEYLIYLGVDKELSLVKKINTSKTKRLTSKLLSKVNEPPVDKYLPDLTTTFDIKDDIAYQNWLKQYEYFNPVKTYAYQPLISIVIPVYNVDAAYLTKCIDSVLAQTYPHFELCIADDCSSNPETLATLARYEKSEERVKVSYRKTNGHISNATNTALKLAQGEFIALMDNDDELAPQALNEVVAVLNNQPQLDFIYSDEDKIDLDGNRSDPTFKPDFCRDTLYAGNYICHFSVIRKTLVEQIGGFTVGLEGAQDFDLFLRLSDATDKIYHIDKILYHWRMIPGSTALNSSSKNYAGEAGQKALQAYFKQKKIAVNVDIRINTQYFIEYLNNDTFTHLIYDVDSLNSDFYTDLQTTLANILDDNYQVHFVGKQPFSCELLDKLLSTYEISDEPVRVYLNELALKHPDDVLVYLKGDWVVDSFNWLNLLTGYAKQEHIGLVGCKLLNIDDVIIESGYITNDTGLIKMIPSAYNSFGTYGRLLVPSDYKMIANKCFALSAEKLNAINGMNLMHDFDYSFMEMALKLNQHYHHVLNSEVNVYGTTFGFKQSSIDAIKADYPDDFKTDVNYNRNLSRTLAFRLDYVRDSNETK